MATNNFADDVRIIEFWRFENNLAAGKAGNDLAAAAGGVGYESDSPLEGFYSLHLENWMNQWAYRADADLSAGFPLKSGDTTKKVSWVFWCYVESLPANGGYPVSKYAVTGNKRSLAFQMDGLGVLTVICGYDSGASGWTCNTGIALAAGRTYHIGVVVDGIAKTVYVRVFDTYDDSIYTYSDSFLYELSITDAPFVVGTTGDLSTTFDWDGYIDELVVANNLLSPDEIDAIRSGTFAGSSPSGGLTLTRAFPEATPETSTFWQSQTGKRKFPL